MSNFQLTPDEIGLTIQDLEGNQQETSLTELLNSIILRISVLENEPERKKSMSNHPSKNGGKNSEQIEWLLSEVEKIRSTLSFTIETMINLLKSEEDN